MILQNHAEADRLARRGAFTLMEMLVVVAIIVVLAGVGGAYLIGQLNEAKVNAAKIKAQTISDAIDRYFIDNSAYPNQLQDLLVQNPETKKGPYLKSQDDIMTGLAPGQVFTYDQSGQIGMQKGRVVQSPDVYVSLPDGRMVGNFK